MNIDSLPLVVFLLLPGFLSWFIFCWGTVSRKISQIQHIFVSLIFSLLAFTLAYYLTYLIKFIGVNIFDTSWNITTFPKYMQILIEPKILPPELWLTIYIIAILLGFLLIAIYKNENLARMLNRIGLDLYGPEGVWYRLFHHSDFITVYLKDGNMIAGWPTYFSQTGEKDNTELYLTKVQYYHENKWTSSHKSVDGVLINTDSIQRIEFRKPDSIIDNRTKQNLKAEPKSIPKFICNPVSQGTLYLSFALSLWTSQQINEPQIKGIAIFLTVISFFFLIAVYSEWVFKITNTIAKYLAFLTFIAFIYGFIIGWLQAFLQVSGITLQIIVYFGFAWIVTILLTEVNDITSKRARISGSILVIIILLAVAGIRFYNHDCIAGGMLIAIAILIILVATGLLKVHGSIFK